MATSRPVYLNLFKIRLPVTGIVSLAHRASGVWLFLMIPYSLYLLERSLQSPQSYEQVMMSFDTLALSLVFFLTLWALLHHFLAGIRFLLLDLDLGVSRSASRLSAWSVVLVEVLLVATLAYRLFV